MTELDIRTIASGLEFPEGPVAMPDGSVVLVEIARGAVTRVRPATGQGDVVASLAGPNGAAIGPDGAIYVCDNGGYFHWHRGDGSILPIPGQRGESYTSGRIARVDLDTGVVTTLYDACDGEPLVAPNDLVFDGHGGFWFTDHGIGHDHLGRPGLLYARADGSAIRGMAYGTQETNGVGLSPAGDRVYVAETMSGTVWEWAVPAPGEIAPLADALDDHSGGRLLFDAPDGHLFDSLAVDGDGWVCVATIGPGGITAISPDGTASELWTVPDEFLVTNICFASVTADGEPDPERRTAYLTASSGGRLVATRWPRPGLGQPHQP